MVQLNDVQVIAASNSFDSTLVLIQDKVQNSDVAFYKVNLGHIVRQFARWRTLVPRVQPFFAIKCQPDPKVISVLGQMGAGFDCASMNEIKSVVETLQFSAEEAADKVIYANPFKFKKDIQYADRVGVSMTTFDTETELVKLAKEWPNAKLVLRLSTPKVYQATSMLGVKFGVDAHEVEHILRRAKELSMDIIGLSFHVGSGCTELDAFPETVVYCAKIDSMARDLGFRPYLIDIGGGFPGLSSTGDDIAKQMDFERMCVKLNSVLDEHFPESRNYRLISEPGRYFVMGAYTLTTQVIGRRSLDISNALSIAGVTAGHGESCEVVGKLSNEGFRYVINDGIYNSFNNIVFDHADPKLRAIFGCDGSYRDGAVDDSTEVYVSTMYGPTCDGLDCILKQVPLPKIEMGEWLVWASMGAYTIAASSCFNGIPMAEKDYYICEEDLSLMEMFCQRRSFQSQLQE